MKGKASIWTMQQSSVLTSLRQLRHRSQEVFWTVSQVRADLPTRWRPGRVQSYNCLKGLVRNGLVEMGPSKLTAEDMFGMCDGKPFRVVGFRLTPLGLQEHDRFLSIMADQIERSNAAPAAGRVAA